MQESWSDEAIDPTLLLEEISCSLQGYIHELDEAKRNIFAIVNSNKSDTETKIATINEVLINVSQIECKTKDINSMSNLVTKSAPMQHEDEIQKARSQIDDSSNEIRKLVSCEIKNLKSTIEIVGSLQREIDGVNNYTTEKHTFFTQESPVSDDEGSIELEPLRVLCSEIESWKLTIESLKGQIKSLQTKPCYFEYEQLLENITKVEKSHQMLTEEAKFFLKTKTEYYERLKKIDDLCELCNVWLETKSKETLNLIQHHSLKSNGMSTQIAQLQRIFNDIKEHEDDTVQKSKELTKLNKYTIESEDLDELKESFVNLKGIVLKNIKSLNEVFEERKSFEKSLEHCVDWIKNSETIVFCDIPDTGHIETLSKHLERFSEIMQEKEDIQETLASLSLEVQKILPTLNASDQITLKSNLQFHSDQVEQLSIRCEKKIQDLSNRIEAIRSTQETTSDYENRMKSIKERLKELKKPIDVNNGGLNHTLEMYKALLEELNSIKNESRERKSQDTSQRYSTKQDEVISIVEDQVVQTAELITIHEQYKSAVTNITQDITSISSELDSVDDIVKAESGLEEVEKFKNINVKVQDCEAQLSLAMDKGDQLARHFSSQDQNEMSSLLGSLKTRLHILKRQTSEKEECPATNVVQEKNNIIEKLVTELLQLENETKSKPIMGLDPTDVDEELQKYTEHENTVKNKIEQLNNVITSLKNEQVSKSEQANIKLSESMISVLPRELLSKRQFLEDQKNARVVFEGTFEKITKELSSAMIKASSKDAENEIDYTTLEDDLNEHQNYFQKLPSDPTTLQTLEDSMYKLSQYTSKDDTLQIDKKKHDIENLITDILELAKSKENDFKENLRQWKMCLNLAPEIEQVIGRIRNTSINSINIHGLRRNIEDCNDNIKLLDDYLEKFETFSDTVGQIQEYADSNTEQRISVEFEPLIDSFDAIRQQNEDTVGIMSSLLEDWNNLEPKIKDLHSRCSQLEQELVSLRTEQASKSIHIEKLRQKTEVFYVPSLTDNYSIL